MSMCELQRMGFCLTTMVHIHNFCFDYELAECNNVPVRPLELGREYFTSFIVLHPSLSLPLSQFKLSR